MSRGWLVFMWAIIGAVVGQLLGHALSPQLPLLKADIPLGFEPTKMDLGFMLLTLGLHVRLSIGGAVGLVLALWLALRSK